jgi:hypothetical protein
LLRSNMILKANTVFSVFCSVNLDSGKASEFPCRGVNRETL